MKTTNPRAPGAPHTESRALPRIVRPLIIIGALTVAVSASAQTQPNSNATTQNPHPVNAQQGAAQVKKPVAPVPQQQQSRWHLPFFGNKQSGSTNNGTGHLNNNTNNSNNPNSTNANRNVQQSAQHFWNNLFHRNSSTPATNTAASALHAEGTPKTPATEAMRQVAGAHRNVTHSATAPVRMASLDSGRAAGRTDQAQSLLGPAPRGTRITQNPSGALVRTAGDGSVMETHDPKTGMTVQHGLDGSRRVTVEQPDGSKVFAASRGVGYVQHPYLFHAQPFDHRTLVTQGRLSQQFYRPYDYGGKTLDVYAPQRYYSPDFYRSINTPYSAPLVPQWNYVTAPTPWYGYYKGYFTPQSSYSTPAEWLTDFILATSLIEAYQSRPQSEPKPGAPAGASAPAGAPAVAAAAPAPAPVAGTVPPAANPTSAAPEITPDVKDKITDEVNRQVREESAEARDNSQGRDPAPGGGGVVRELTEKEPHVFVADADLDLVDPSGRRCMLTEGDVVQVVSSVNSHSGSAQAVVLASKGSGECERATQVDIAVSDLQEMQNHMRETIDQGMASSRAGGAAAKTTPAFAAAAPPPDQNARAEVQRQQELAAAADG
jgi:hypothetical protein